MPPANSPPEPDIVPDPQTRVILQQLEALANPVPNLAATLTDVSAETRFSSVTMSEPRSIPGEAIPLSRSTRRSREPYLTEREFRDSPSEGRRRMQERLEVINDGRTPTMQSYSDRIPTQQSLYDWAAYHADSDSESDNSSGEVLLEFRRENREGRSAEEQEERRELLSSLNESRRWRSQLRRDLEPREEPSGRITLPSLQHLRRSVQDLPEITNDTAERIPAPRSPSVTAALSRLIERQRLERRERPWDRREWPAAVSYREPDPITDEERARVRRHLLDLRRRDRVAQRLDKHRGHRPNMPKTVSTLKYLSSLREIDSQQDALNLAVSLKIHELQRSPADLLVSTHNLPPPQSSSFLTPGTTFKGVQQAPQELPATLLNRDRDFLRRMVANRNLNMDAAGALQNAEVILGQMNDAASAGVSVGDMQRTELPRQADPAHYVQNRLTRIRQERRQRNEAAAQAQAPTSAPQEHCPDSWPVRVTLHTLSLHPNDMTISGTMSASHIPDKLPSAAPDHKPEGSSMESYFEGEIVDFAHHALETNPDDHHPRRFPNCGAEVDARYWSGVGPFRTVAEAVRRKTDEQRRRRRERAEVAGAVGDVDMNEEEEMEKEVDNEIARCLGNRKWLEAAVGGEGEWVLMRWKERCFVSPSSHPSTSPTQALSASTAEYHLRRLATTNSSSSTSVMTPAGCLGLTISGFYYIALHRASGRIEGLYFDPGSQPFQELRLGVEGGQAAVPVDGDLSGTGRLGLGVGLKRWFPSVEFR